MGQFRGVAIGRIVSIIASLLTVARFGSAATLPPGFHETTIASALAAPTAMAIAPDGRIFVCQQGGQLRVIKNDVLLSTPFLTVTVDSSGERGLLGVAFDPNFASNRYVYIYYTATTPSVHNRVSRFTANSDVAIAGSELVLLDLNPLSSATNHNGGAIHFGPDGKLYVGVGDNANGANAQTLTNMLGKMLRINSNGTIPADNPFYSTATGNNRAIWAIGLRNPFTFDFHPVTGRMFINDVGQSTSEEVNEGIAGANYGWPTTEGYTGNPAFKSPIYAYSHSSGTPTGCAITGGAFYAPQAQRFPVEFRESYFLADLCSGWIGRLDLVSQFTFPLFEAFEAGVVAPVDLHVSNLGDLYYLARGPSGSTGIVARIRFDHDMIASDFDGDAKADITTYTPSTGEWRALTSANGFASVIGAVHGSPADVPVPGDYDRDGKPDFAVYTPSTGVWSLRTSSSDFTATATYPLGGPTDLPVPGDYDGDGITDLAIYSQAAVTSFPGHTYFGVWMIRHSFFGYISSGISLYYFGLPTDVPVAGDYDGDGKTDLALYRPSNNGWYVLKSSTSLTSGFSVPWGSSAAGDIPVPADWDNDGRTDLAVFRPSTSGWYILPSSKNFTSGAFALSFGDVGDIPAPGDYDGDGRPDPAVYRPWAGVFYFLSSTSGYTATNIVLVGGGSDDILLVNNPISYALGHYPDDTRRASDFDKDARSDITIARPIAGQFPGDGGLRWLTLKSSTNFNSASPLDWPLGTDDSLPMPGDYDRDGKTDRAVYRPADAQWFLQRSTDGSFAGAAWGSPGDTPVPGDYDGDGKTDVAVFHPPTGTWLLSMSGGGSSLSVQFGETGDIPIPADYDGDRRTDLALFRPSNNGWYIARSSSNFTTAFAVGWGDSSAGDIAIPMDWDRDGRADLTVFRPSIGAWFVLPSRNGYTAGTLRFVFGATGDIPVVGDYDGDGKPDPVLFRPSPGIWWLLMSGAGYSSVTGIPFGQSGDIPILKRP
jgi:glucose/arabinose dehydrogenase